MRSGDRSLVIFTILSQWSVGIVVCLSGLAMISGTQSLALNTGPRLANPVWLALLLVVVATTASFLHLGTPSNAPKAIRNLATSWLSREILAIGLYTISLAGALLYGWSTGGAAYRGFLLAPCAITGLLLLWTMARVYRLPTVPAWNSGHTPLAFTLTTLCLGAMSFLLLVSSGAFGLDSRAFTIIKGLLAAALVLEIAAGWLQQRRLLKLGTGIDGPAFDRGTWHILFLVRLALLLASLLAVTLLVSHPEYSSENTALYGLYAIVALVVVQEVIGRVLFYASYFRIGV